MGQTQFLFCTKDVRESIKVLQELNQNFRFGGVYYYFPFTEAQLRKEECIEKQMRLDAEKIDIENAGKELTRLWNDHKREIQTALDILQSEGKTILPVYKCNLTFYGTHGYYSAPDTIFLNISEGNKEFWLETLLHEFLHLVLYDELLNLPYKESEKVVDKMCVRLFGEIFPNYKEQFQG